MSSDPVSPLAPKVQAELPPIRGVRLGTAAAGLKYRGRDDLMVMRFDAPAAAAGVFTRSACASAPVEWCRERLGAPVQAVVVNAGNANAFTGANGRRATRMTADAAAGALGCEADAVWLASTGVIGEPLDASGFGAHLDGMALAKDGWWPAARAIMTTDTYAKAATATFEAAGRTWRINGIAKGSGMIAPDMATMLAFTATDAPVAVGDLQTALATHVETTFNAITVDSDTSTSDTLMLFATGEGDRLAGDDLDAFGRALHTLLHDLAMQTVRDGEGATKHVEVRVEGAASDASAKTIALAVANSPLVKTAIAGEDANWGRVVMAVGKAGEPADRDRLSISFGSGGRVLRVASLGERDPDYDEADASAIMTAPEILLAVDLGLGDGRATVWTCDLTKRYVAINGDYRS